MRICPLIQGINNFVQGYDLFVVERAVKDAGVGDVVNVDDIHNVYTIGCLKEVVARSEVVWSPTSKRTQTIKLKPLRQKVMLQFVDPSRGRSVFLHHGKCSPWIRVFHRLYV